MDFFGPQLGEGAITKTVSRGGETNTRPYQFGLRWGAFPPAAPPGWR